MLKLHLQGKYLLLAPMPIQHLEKTTVLNKAQRAKKAGP
jgi:hypothetical protein